jgi:broad-specificity NMP kinase
MPKKKFVMINGSMGVGKTTTCKALYTKLPNSVWLDGDWCWMMHPWNITDENKGMVMANIHFLLKSYLANSSFDYIIFSWVMHQEEIFDKVLSGLQEFDFELYKITLICSEKSLIHRMQADGRTDAAHIQESVRRLERYQQMATIKIDTTNCRVPETVEKILALISN